MHNMSTRAYEHMRSEGILRLPSRSTLQRFLGSSGGEVDITNVVKESLFAELANYSSPQARICFLIVDEMRIKKRLLYLKQKDAFIGEVDYGDVLPLKSANEPVLGNALLCFILNGLSVRFRITVAYFFTQLCAAC